MGPFNNLLMSYFMLELESHCGIFPSQVKLPTRKNPNLANKLQTKSSSSEEDSSDEASVEYFMYLTDKTQRKVEIRVELVKSLIYKDQVLDTYGLKKTSNHVDPCL